MNITTASSAVLSECGTYRYWLQRPVDMLSKPTGAFVMLNPSTADAHADDPTIRRCAGFAARWGWRDFVVVNLFAYRATDPRVLATAHDGGVDVVGPACDFYFDVVVESAWPIVAAWGANIQRRPAFLERARVVADRLVATGRASCLGRAKNGAPRHPLMLPYDTALEPL